MKKVALLLAALMLAALFSGCGGDNSDEKWTAQDLAGKTVGVQIGAPGAFLALELAGKLEGMQVRMYRSAADAAADLNSGTVDAIIVESGLARDIINANDGLKHAGTGIFEPETYAVAVKKGNKELLGLINVVIDEIKSGDELDRLIKGFIYTPEDERGDYITGAQTGDEGILRVAVSAELKPFDYVLEDGSPAGFNVEIAKLIAKKVNKTLECIYVDSAMLPRALRSGTVDFAFVRMSTWDDELESVEFSNTYYTSNQALIIRAK
jgi:polar amino acid transport system substrate-binding protein